MLAVDKAKNPKSLAQIHEVSILWDRPDGSKELYPTMHPITLAGYHARGGTQPALPSHARVATGGRADIRLSTRGHAGSHDVCGRTTRRPFRTSPGEFGGSAYLLRGGMAAG